MDNRMSPLLPWLLLLLLQVNTCAGVRCSGLARYEVSFQGLWSRNVFYKQYPLFRPPAQWSKLMGRVHNDQFVFWREGQLCSTGVKKFAETADSSELDNEVQGTDIFDTFNARPVPAGEGTASVLCLAHPSHSKVSVMAKIIPSPDWFVGVDSLELCAAGDWLQQKVIDLHPFDAGTDQGYTFTSPNWAAVPHKPISRITAKKPDHPANSFFYDKYDELPRIGRLTVSLKEVYHTQSEPQRALKVAEVTPEVRRVTPTQARQLTTETTSTLTTRDLRKQSRDASKQARLARLRELRRRMREEKKRKRLERRRQRQREAAETKSTTKQPMSRENATANQRPERTNNSSEESLEHARSEHNAGRSAGMHNTGVSDHWRQRMEQRERERQQRRRAELERRYPGREIRDCQVTEWQPWGPCSKTCGYGTKTRRRAQIQEPTPGGASCPALEEDALCGSMRGCEWGHFESVSWSRERGQQ